MALPSAFLEELRARTPLAALIGRRVRLVRSGRQHRGCCPFHGEKTPSFYVYDDHFHCFGCGAHGDAVTFVMQSEGATFPEAVARLAAEAGLEVPRPSRGQAEAEQKRLDQRAVLEAAQAGFRRRLSAEGGAPARAYLAGRGLSTQTIEAWGLGWSGPGRGDLARELAALDVTPAMMAEAGLMRLGEDGAPAGELFFGRVTFPIHDARGRLIAFGGRILGDGQPKYLNGPETGLFSKRRTLFGLHAARAGLRTGAEIVVVEGYMDVIALHQAGLSGAVAPLGTALTEEQLTALWQIAPMPILCFDGDAAGARAAIRAVEMALPHLTGERSLRLARLPAGEDPDSLVRRQGPAAFAALLRAARPVGTALYDLLAEGAGDGPEARAVLRTRLETAAGRIADRALSREIRRALLDRFFQSGARGAPRGRPAAPVRLPPPGAADVSRTRWLLLAGLLIRHPELRGAEREAFAAVPAPQGLEEFGRALAFWHETETVSLDSDPLVSHLAQVGLADLVAQALDALGDRRSETATPAQAWRHYFTLMHAHRLDDDIAHAEALARQGDAAALRMLARFAEERLRLTDAESGLDAPF